MLEREYYFSDLDRERAEKSGIADIAQKIDDFEAVTIHNDEPVNVYRECGMMLDAAENVEREFNELRKSSLWRSLSDEERRLSCIAIDKSDEASWSILGPNADAEGRLFGVPRFAGRVACSLQDCITLSGTGGLEFTNFEPKIFDSHQSYEFKTMLEFMQFAGAWLCNVTNGGRDEKPSFVLADIYEKDMKRQVTLGGDIHGDFRMQEVLIPEYGSISPHGYQVTFAPLSERASVAGYYSIEKSIVTAICAHIIDSGAFLENEKRFLFDILLSERMPSVAPELGSNFYGNFGGDWDDGRTVATELDGMRLRAKTGDSYMAAMVVPGNEQALLEVTKRENGNLEMKNTYKDTGIEFRPLETSNLLELFMAIGKVESRTSIDSIMHALRCAQQILLDGEEAGHIILRED
jgi:hypothetical protein